MTIASASAVRVRISFRHPFVTAVGRFEIRDAWIVRIRDTHGHEGVGEASLDPAAGPEALEALAAAVRAWVMTPRRPPAADDPDPIRRAVAAAFAGAIEDHALHGSPLGPGFIPVNATVATEDLDDTLDTVERALDAGFVCLKIKVGDEPTADGLAERLTLVRALVGPDIELRLDANGAWEPEVAVDRLAAIGHLGIAYVEQPIQPGDIASMAEIRRLSPVDIAADELVGTRADAEAILAAGAADALVIKLGRVGGPLEARAIARAAIHIGAGVTISNLLETGVGLAAAIRVAAGLPKARRTHAHGLGTADLLVDDLLATPIEVIDGRVAVPTEPLVLDESAVARWAVERVGDDR